MSSNRGVNMASHYSRIDQVSTALGALFSPRLALNPALV